MLQRQNGNDAFQSARRTQRVRGHGFGRTHRDGIGAFAENFLDRPGFHGIINGSRRAVGIDVIDIFAGQTAVSKRRLHGTDGAGSIFIRGRHMERIAGNAVAQNFPVDFSAAGQSFLQRFQYHNRRRFAQG